MKWENKFEKNNNIEQNVKDILNYVNYNKKCKLPWNMTEIEEAI